jgi:hypothetical protein
MKSDEIAIETAKTGKVTVVVAVMSIFSEKRCKFWKMRRLPKGKKSQFSEGKFL